MARSIVRILVVVLALLALVGVVSADGGINGSANGYFGGDSLFCSGARGCWLLNANRPAKGSAPALLGEFAQADIQAALTTCKADATNVIIGTIQGTFGPFTLSAVYDGPNAKPVCSLQVNAFEAAGKEAKPYVFEPLASGGYASMDTSIDLSADCFIQANRSPYVRPFFNSGTGSGKTDGYDLYRYDNNMQLGLLFVRWSETDEGLVPCHP
jgi:hypothetical protein